MTQLQDHPAVSIPGSFRHIDVTQVSGAIGAVVGGIRAGGDVAPAALAELLHHKVRKGDASSYAPLAA